MIYNKVRHCHRLISLIYVSEVSGASHCGNYCRGIYHCSCGMRNLFQHVCGNYPAGLSRPFGPVVLFHWFLRAEVWPWPHILTSQNFILISDHNNTHPKKIQLRFYCSLFLFNPFQSFTSLFHFGRLLISVTSLWSHPPKNIKRSLWDRNNIWFVPQTTWSTLMWSAAVKYKAVSGSQCVHSDWPLLLIHAPHPLRCILKWNMRAALKLGTSFRQFSWKRSARQWCIDSY